MHFEDILTQNDFATVTIITNNYQCSIGSVDIHVHKYLGASPETFATLVHPLYGALPDMVAATLLSTPPPLQAGLSLNSVHRTRTTVQVEQWGEHKQTFRKHQTQHKPSASFT